MRAAFVAPRLEVGGFERQWAHLVPGLATKGVDIELFTLDGTGRFFDEIAARGIGARCLDVHGRLNIAGAVRAGMAIAARSPDVVFSTGVSALVVAHVAAHRARAAHVTAIHSVPEHPDTFTTRRRALVRIVAPRVAASTLVTEAQLELLASLHFRRERAHIIPNGVPTPAIGRERRIVRMELGLGDEAFVALVVASLRPEKRVDRFADAIAAARRRDERILGVIAGGGPGLDATRSAYAERDDVLVLGPRTDTADLMRAADVICLTSDAEALPLAILEAMACAKPVVATDVGGVRDAVVDGETGILVSLDGGVQSFADALVRVAADPASARALGELGRTRHAERFTVERMVEAHFELFQHVTGTASEPAPARGAREKTA